MSEKTTEPELLPSGPKWASGDPMELHRLLSEPFPAADLEWRPQSGGVTDKGKIWALILCYVTNRAIQQRLDDVVGPGKWKNEYQFVEGGALCGLSIMMGGQLDTHWITKWDGADRPDTEPFKGVVSNAMKRAGVQWGIGRYLYDLESTFADTSKEKAPGIQKALIVNKKKIGYWGVPRDAVPTWALPEASKAELEEYDKRKAATDPKAMSKAVRAWLQAELENAENALNAEQREWLVGKLDTPLTLEELKKVEKTVKRYAYPQEEEAPPPAKTTAKKAAPKAQAKATAAGKKKGRFAEGVECPECGGKMWDNTEDKRYPTSPDYRCAKKGNDPDCEGFIQNAGESRSSMEDGDPPEDDDLPF